MTTFSSETAECLSVVPNDPFTHQRNSDTPRHPHPEKWGKKAEGEGVGGEIHFISHSNSCWSINSGCYLVLLSQFASVSSYQTTVQSNYFELKFNFTSTTVVIWSICLNCKIKWRWENYQSSEFVIHPSFPIVSFVLI